MSRVTLFAKALWASALVACIAAGMIVPAHAAITVQVVAAGSSAMWQNSALAAYASGACVNAAGGCKHYTGKSFHLLDQRTGTFDTGNIWIVWDKDPNPTDVWMYISVDSVVGDRCYFAQPRCLIEVPAPPVFPASAGLISLALWGADSPVPATVQALLTAAPFQLVNTAATDIRPEDAYYATCRANASFAGDANNDKGLGYNPNNPWNGDQTGDIYCPPNVAAGGSTATLIGNPVLSSFSGSAQVIAFNISGTDPFPPNSAIPSYTVVSVGASPIVFLTRRLTTNNVLKNVFAASDKQLQCVYTNNGGPTQNGSCFGFPGPLDVFQREPLSGTMNTTEFSVFRNNPFQTFFSQENGMGGGLINPLTQPGPLCSGPGTSGRFRVVGTGQMVSEIATSTTPADNSCDAIGYAFFSFGNVLPLAGNANYGYLALDGLDPIGPGPLIPAGAPAQQLPNGNAFPAATTCPGLALPCNEFQLWGNGVFSFPSLRAAGTDTSPYSVNVYRAWSVLRFVADAGSPALTSAQALATGAQQAAVCSVPDFVPAVRTVGTCGITDPGLQNWRAHYNLVYSKGGAATTVTANNGICTASLEKGRDEGGCVVNRACPAGDTVHLGQEYTDLGANPLGQCSAPVFP